MSRYAVTRQLNADRMDAYRAHVERDLKHELGMKLVEQLPLDEPTMVRIRRDERDGRQPFSPNAPHWMDERAIEIRYEFELRRCHSMDITVQRMVYRDPEPEIRYVDREVPVPVFIHETRPTFWQRVTTHLKTLAAGVQYDGGYGEPE